MGANMQKMMKQMQQMQTKMAKMQEELAQTPVEATAGGGVVKVVVNGANEVLSVEINPEVLDPDDPEMVQDLVMAAVNEARRGRADADSEEIIEIGLFYSSSLFPCFSVIIFFQVTDDDSPGSRSMDKIAVFKE